MEAKMKAITIIGQSNNKPKNERKKSKNLLTRKKEDLVTSRMTREEIVTRHAFE